MKVLNTEQLLRLVRISTHAAMREAARKELARRGTPVWAFPESDRPEQGEEPKRVSEAIRPAPCIAITHFTGHSTV